jgi:hypothetical protein
MGTSPKGKRKEPLRINQPTNPTELFTQRTFEGLGFRFHPKDIQLPYTFEFHKHKPPLWRKFVVYVEGTLYSLISLLEIGRDIIPTYTCKNPPTIEDLA